MVREALLAVVVAVALSSTLAAQEIVSTEDVIAMVAAGVDEFIIIDVVRSAEAVDFEVGPQGVIALTNEGISERILAAMIVRAAETYVPRPQLQGDPPGLVMGIEAPEPRRRRSMARTIGGVSLAALGFPAMLVGAAATTEVCVGALCVGGGGPATVVAFVGGGMLVTGVLLATVWSDVPVANSMDIIVTPSRIQVGKSFGF